MKLLKSLCLVLFLCLRPEGGLEALCFWVVRLYVWSSVRPHLLVNKITRILLDKF